MWYAPLLVVAISPPSQQEIEQSSAGPALVDEVLRAIEPEGMLAVVEGLVLFGTRHTLSDTESDERGIGAARRWLLAEFESIAQSGGDATGRLAAHLDPHELSVRGGRTAEVVNVVAVLPGSLPEARDRRYYVLGHYDSRASGGFDADADAPGANDDASGVAVVMELARVLARHEFDSTLVFLATAGEEQGLWGATNHVEAAVAAGLDVRAALNNDIVGDPSGPADASGVARSARDRVRVFSEGVPAQLEQRALSGLRRLSSESDSPSRQLARFVARVADLHRTAVRPMLVHRPDRFLRGGDQTPFNANGIAAVRFSEVYETYARQHQDVREEDGVRYGDLPEFIDGDYLADVARLNAAALIHLANAPSVPGEPRLVIGGLSNDTTLRWESSPEPDVAGYEVVWRETTAADWTHSLDVGDANEATIDLSMDNWFFGVRAYDREGYKSPVGFPGVGR